VLYLHGGPATSQLASNRRNTRDVEHCLTVVNWDQRGAGKSYAAIRDGGAMNIDQFVDDTQELTRHLLRSPGVVAPTDVAGTLVAPPPGRATT
jgi:proline iminopeptidase